MIMTKQSVKLTDKEIKKIIYYLKECYEEINEDLIEENNYIFLPAIEFHRDEQGEWIPI